MPIEGGSAHYTNTALTCDCTKAPILVESHVTLCTTTSRMHCPTCGKRAHSATQTDVHHIQAMHANLPYLAVKLGLTIVANTLGASATKRAKYRLPNPNLDASNATAKRNGYYAQNHAIDSNLRFEDKYVRELYATQAAATVSHGVCCLNVSCKTCGAVYNVTRHNNEPPTEHNGIQFCVYCGKDTLNVIPSSTEETAWQVLGEHYNIHPIALQLLYKEWTTNSLFSDCHTFQAFLNSYSKRAQAEVSKE